MNPETNYPVASSPRLYELYLEGIDEFNRWDVAHEGGGCQLSPTKGGGLVVIELQKVLSLLPHGGTLLDVGTGHGLVPRILHRLGAKVISTDFPSTGGTGRLNRLMDLGIEGHFLQVGAEPLPLRDENVDVVFVGNVIEHLPHSPRPFVLDLKRVLKKGGWMVMDTKNAVDLKTRLKMLAGVSNWPLLEGIYPGDINPHHHKEYTLAELTRLLVLAGFQNVQGFAHEVFFHLSLKKLGAIHAMGAQRSELSQFGTGFNPLHPYEYARIVLLGITRLFPGLRSDIMAIGQKPL